MKKLTEQLTTKWFDTSVVIPESGRDVWFIADGRICVGVYEAEQKMFCMADMQGVELASVRQWCYLDGEKHKGEYPKEMQIVAAYIKDLPCFVTGIFSKHFIDTKSNSEVAGIQIDEIYDLMNLPIARSLLWTNVFEWYPLPSEPIVVLEPCDCCSDVIEQNVEEMIPEVVEDTNKEIEDIGTPSNYETKSAIAKYNKELMMKKESKNKFTEARICYDLTDGTYKPWSGAVSTWETIIDNDKLDELDAFLDELYPEGLSEVELNDLLWFDSEYVLENLGLSEEEEDEDEDYEDEDYEDDDEEEEDDEE